MPKLVILALAAVAVLMLKHAVADFYLQTPYQYRNKGPTVIPAASSMPASMPC
jgi:hypothetical protein